MKLSEQLLRSYIRKLLIREKKWADFNAPKGVTIALTPEDFDSTEEAVDIEDTSDGVALDTDTSKVRNLNDEIFDLIQNAYGDVPLGGDKFGNIKVQSPSDLPGEYTIMSAGDIDGDLEPDYFRGGKMQGGRYKMGVVGHDGSAAAIQMYLDETAKELQTGTGIGEMSGKIAHIMITRHGVPAVTSKEQVESLLGKKVNWIGRHPDEERAEHYGPNYEGWYTRSISGPGEGEHMKILLGGE